MRKAILRMAILCGLCAWAVMALRPVLAHPASGEDQVMVVEHAREEALAKNDFAALDKILAEDLRYCHGSGVVQTKAEFLNMLKTGGNRYLKYELSNVKIHADGNIAVIDGTSNITVNPGGRGERNEEMIVTLVYEKRGGEWKMISSQSTRAPEAAAVVPVSPAK